MQCCCWIAWRTYLLPGLNWEVAWQAEGDKDLTKGLLVRFRGQEGDDLDNLQVSTDRTGTIEDRDDVFRLINGHVDFAADPVGVHSIGREDEQEDITSS